MAKLAVIDAGALIALYDPDDAHHPWAISVFAETSNYELAMSPLTMAEVMVYPAKEGALENFKSGIQGLGVLIKPLDAADSEQLALLRSSSGLKMPDVVVLQLAQKTSASVITTDYQVSKIARSLGLASFCPS